MAIFLFDTRDGNVDVPSVALPPEPEIAVPPPVGDRSSRTLPISHQNPPYSRRNGQIREIQVVHVQRGA